MRWRFAIFCLWPLFLPAGCDGAGGPGVPSGMIAMFERECPSGWTRYEALDGRFPRGAPEAGNSGGESRHSHYTEITARTSKDGEHVHNLAAGDPVEVDRGVFGDIGMVDGMLKAFEEGGHDRMKAARALSATDPAGAHDHFISVRAESEEAESLPPYLEFVFCRKD